MYYNILDVNHDIEIYIIFQSTLASLHRTKSRSVSNLAAVDRRGILTTLKDVTCVTLSRNDTDTSATVTPQCPAGPLFIFSDFTLKTHYPSLYPSVHLSVHPSIYLSISSYLSIK